MTESAPDFKQAQTELAAMRTQMARAEKEEPAAIGSDSDYIARFRDFKYQETLFELFAKQYEMARIDESCFVSGQRSRLDADRLTVKREWRAYHCPANVLLPYDPLGL
ncbi:MAG: hypothetical protein WCK83_16670 [Burkholderiales bacterium]